MPSERSLELTRAAPNCNGHLSHHCGGCPDYIDVGLDRRPCGHRNAHNPRRFKPSSRYGTSACSHCRSRSRHRPTDRRHRLLWLRLRSCRPRARVHALLRGERPRLRVGGTSERVLSAQLQRSGLPSARLHAVARNGGGGAVAALLHYHSVRVPTGCRGFADPRVLRLSDLPGARLLRAVCCAPARAACRAAAAPPAEALAAHDRTRGCVGLLCGACGQSGRGRWAARGSVSAPSPDLDLDHGSPLIQSAPSLASAYVCDRAPLLCTELMKGALPTAAGDRSAEHNFTLPTAPDQTSRSA